MISMFTFAKNVVVNILSNNEQDNNNNNDRLTAFDPGQPG